MIRYENKIGNNVFYTFAVLCKETSISTNFGCEKSIIKGNIYYASQITGGASGEIMKNTYCIYLTPCNAERENYIGNFNHKYFTTPAEWREQQINDILND